MDEFARDVVLMKQCNLNPVVVHGGGPMINDMLKRLDIVSEFVDGKRVTDAATVEVVEMVLSGRINKRIVAAINAQGGKAVGLSGKDANLMICEKDLGAGAVDLGFVGRPVEVNPDVLRTFLSSDFIPVVAPIGAGRDGETFNVNGDTAAGAIAAAMKADRLLLLTDVAGVKDASGAVLTQLTSDEVRVADGRRRDRRGDDPQDRDRARGGRGRGAGGGDPRRPRAACGAARAVHRARRRHADPGRAAAPDLTRAMTPEAAAAAEGLAVLGGFHPEPGDGAPEGAATILLLGPDGPRFWERFRSSAEFADGGARSAEPLVGAGDRRDGAASRRDGAVSVRRAAVAALPRLGAAERARLDFAGRAAGAPDAGPVRVLSRRARPAAPAGAAARRRAAVRDLRASPASTHARRAR